MPGEIYPSRQIMKSREPWLGRDLRLRGRSKAQPWPRKLAWKRRSRTNRRDDVMVDVSPWNNMHVHRHVAFDGMLGTCRIEAPYPYLRRYAGIGSRKDDRVVGAYPEMHDMSIARDRAGSRIVRGNSRSPIRSRLQVRAPGPRVRVYGYALLVRGWVSGRRPKKKLLSRRHNATCMNHAHCDCTVSA